MSKYITVLDDILSPSYISLDKQILICTLYLRPCRLFFWFTTQILITMITSCKFFQVTNYPNKLHNVSLYILGSIVFVLLECKTLILFSCCSLLKDALSNFFLEFRASQIILHHHFYPLVLFLVTLFDKLASDIGLQFAS